MSRKPRPTPEKPPPHTDEAEPRDRKPPATERARPAEPFEECGPSGGYGGAGTDEVEYAGTDEVESKDAGADEVETKD